MENLSVNTLPEDAKKYFDLKFKRVKSYRYSEVMCNFDLLVVQCYFDIYSENYFEDKITGVLTNTVDEIIYDPGPTTITDEYGYYLIKVKEELTNDYMIFIFAKKRSYIIQ